MGQDGTSVRKPSTGGHKSPVEGGWGVGWGRDSLIKTYEKNGDAPQNFEKNPFKEEQILSHRFRLNTPNRYCSRSQCTPFEVRHPMRKQKPHFKPLKGTTGLFIKESPPAQELVHFVPVWCQQYKLCCCFLL